MQSRADSLFILADDLSGAADCAVAASRRGLASVVLLEPEARNSLSQVIAVDADSRHCSAEEAKAINTSLWQSFSAPGRLFYKKIDSTLRGNFGAEMAALKDAGVAIVAPAFPDAGRTTHGGKVFVRGIPLDETEIWSREKMQGDADIVAILEANGVSAVNVPLATIRGDLSGELAKLIASGKTQAIVCDAESDADLAAIASASISLPVYWVGSAGLVSHLPGAAGMEQAPVSPKMSVNGPILTVVGSLSSVSRQQAAELEARAELVTVELAVEVLRTGEAHPQWRELSKRIGNGLSAEFDMVIRIGMEDENDLAQGHVLCRSLARLLQPWLSRIGALVATGGETARGLLLAFGAFGLQIVREIESGVPVSISLGARQIPVITKAGAFGSPSALFNCYSELSAVRRQSGIGQI